MLQSAVQLPYLGWRHCLHPNQSIRQLDVAPGNAFHIRRALEEKLIWIGRCQDDRTASQSRPLPTPLLPSRCYIQDALFRNQSSEKRAKEIYHSNPKPPKKASLRLNVFIQGEQANDCCNVTCSIRNDDWSTHAWWAGCSQVQLWSCLARHRAQCIQIEAPSPH